LLHFLELKKNDMRWRIGRFLFHASTNTVRIVVVVVVVVVASDFDRSMLASSPFAQRTQVLGTEQGVDNGRNGWWVVVLLSLSLVVVIGRCRIVQRGGTRVGTNRHISASDLEQKVNHTATLVLGGDHQRCFTTCVGEIHVRPVVDQELRHAHVAQAGGNMESGRTASFHTTVRVEITFDEHHRQGDHVLAKNGVAHGRHLLVRWRRG
jgi:hypothetical protein